MANQLLANPYPAGFDSTQNTLTVNGSILLAGSAVATGEPINWTSLIDGIGYNEINYRGNGKHGTGGAYTTGFAVSAGTCTVTANNNFSAGQQVTFLGNTQTLSALFNAVVVTIVTATSTTFTFTTTQTGTTTTSDVGIAFRYLPVTIPEPGDNYTQNLTVTALSASGTTLTVTAANLLLPGAKVTITVATGTLGPKLAGLQLAVLNSTGTAFTATMPSALSGSTGTGTGTGVNPAVPYSVKFWSDLASGYVYQYDSATGCLFVYQGGAGTPSGTISAPVFAGTPVVPTITIGAGTPATFPVGTAANTGTTTLVATAGVTIPVNSITPAGTNSVPTFSGDAGSAGALTPLSAAAYPAAVLNDVIKYEAKFVRG